MCQVSRQHTVIIQKTKQNGCQEEKKKHRNSKAMEGKMKSEMKKKI